MAELTNSQAVNSADYYYEDEFGLGLKIFLGIRVLFYAIGIFMILGALVCLALGLVYPDELVSSATGLSATGVDANYDGYTICMYVQAAYTVLSAAAVVLLLIKRTKLFAIADLALFVILLAVLIVTGSIDLLTNGSAWLLYIILGPVISFIALLAGKHFKYMPFK